MENPIKNLIPPPKKGHEFLSSSHYKIGFDGREVKNNMVVSKKH